MGCDTVSFGRHRPIYLNEYDTFNRRPEKLKSRERITTALHTSYSTTSLVLTVKLCISHFTVEIPSL
jgi:hypothetical protein